MNDPQGLHSIITGNGRSILSNISFKPLHEVESGIRAVQSTEWSEAVSRAASPHSGACSSPLDEWSRDLVREMGVQTAIDFYEYKVDLLAFTYKLYVDHDDSDEYVGVYGRETADLDANHDGCERFWSNADRGHTLNTDDIALLGVHGSDLKDYSKLYATVELLVEDGTNVRDAVRAYQEFIEGLPHGFDNPLLTANALAASEGADSDGGTLADSILVGDGMVEFLRHMNLGTDGPEFVHAHEFAHHMQFEVDIGFGATGNETPEDSRRIELMADAFGAYYLAHERGVGMSNSRIQEVFQAAYAVGDCIISEEGHHGTPAQRACATVWGANQAAASGGSSDIMHPTSLRRSFDSALEGIVKLDEDVCKLEAKPVPDPDYNGNRMNHGLSPYVIIIFSVVAAVLISATAIFACLRRRRRSERQRQAGPITDDEDWTSEDEGGWACRACTYRNPNEAHLACSLCGTPRNPTYNGDEGNFDAVPL